MKSVVITPKNASELKFLTDFLSWIGMNSHTLSAEEMEDIGMSNLMKQVDRSKKVSREAIMNRFRK